MLCCGERTHRLQTQRQIKQRERYKKISVLRKSSGAALNKHVFVELCLENSRIPAGDGVITSDIKAYVASRIAGEINDYKINSMSHNKTWRWKTHGYCRTCRTTVVAWITLIEV